jgi:hypothetical protein
MMAKRTTAKRTTAKRMILGGLEWRLDSNQTLKDLEANLQAAMEDGTCYTVVLADGGRLLVNGARAEYAMFWESVDVPGPPPVAEVGSRVGM